MVIIQNPGHSASPRLGRPVGADAAAALAWLLGSHGEAKGWEREGGSTVMGKEKQFLKKEKKKRKHRIGDTVTTYS